MLHTLRRLPALYALQLACVLNLPGPPLEPLNNGPRQPVDWIQVLRRQLIAVTLVPDSIPTLALVFPEAGTLQCAHLQHFEGLLQFLTAGSCRGIASRVPPHCRQQLRGLYTAAAAALLLLVLLAGLCKGRCCWVGWDEVTVKCTQNHLQYFA